MTRASDTSAEAEAEVVQLAAIRARSPEARLRDALELSELVHAAVIARLRARYPERSTVELALMLGADEALIHQAFAARSRIAVDPANGQSGATVPLHGSFACSPAR